MYYSKIIPFVEYLRFNETIKFNYIKSNLLKTNTYSDVNKFRSIKPLNIRATKMTINNVTYYRIGNRFYLASDKSKIKRPVNPIAIDLLNVKAQLKGLRFIPDSSEEIHHLLKIFKI